MCCNIVYTKMEDKRTWNLRKDRKWKRRAEEPAGRKPTGFRKKERSGRSGARTQDRPVTCQICLRIFGCACLRHWAGCLSYYKEKNQPTWSVNWFLKKERSGRSGTRTQDRPVTCQICLRIFGFACLRHWAGCLPYYKEKNQSAENTNWFMKKRSEVDALGLEPRTVRLWAGCSNQLS